MSLFSKERSYLGVDIGKGSIKVVELSNDKGRARLVTYGFVEQKVEEVIEKDFIDAPERTGKIIKRICEKAGTKSKKVVAALPIFSVFSSILNLTNVSKKEFANSKLLNGRVEWEAKKIIPLPLEEMILDWKIIKTNKEKKLKEKKESAAGFLDNKTKKADDNNSSRKNKKAVIKEGIENIQILLTAAPKKIVEKYIKIFKYAGLELLSLETESFALIRSLVGADKSPLFILDSGAGRTSISIINKGIPYLNRSIDVGGAVITGTLAKRLGMDMEHAEQFKLDMASGRSMDTANILEIISSTLKPIVNEILYSLNIYRGQKGAPEAPIEKIIITGGGALLNNFSEYLAKELDMRAYIGDPWARVIYPEDLKPVLDDLGPRFAVAVGLAMRDIE